MRRKTGPGDITYCVTPCVQERCKRNCRYWKAPTMYCSMASFDSECKDEIHVNCEHKWLEEEVKKK